MGMGWDPRFPFWIC